MSFGAGRVRARSFFAPAAPTRPVPGAAAPRPPLRPEGPRPQTPDGLKNQPLRRLRSGVWGGAPEGREG
ncbi:hypothetical protein EJ357_29125 [Streptomyces cyaneochromogenes]|uniref:Uncharacterized protein n=1 Tax=Streptomyces cyaneochromogenes TaxID=2496836 RepID=A0A3Q9EQI0_9ACTN|nr:hypothetical protein EJ357_29125 [Streptomyces cyaneochromogenes]